MEQSQSLDELLKLLKGERDEQRLAGLLLVTKICKGDDHESIRKVYEAVGPQFLDRLLRTGMGKGATGSTAGANRDAYLQLSVTVIAAFCRVPEIASSGDMISKIPLIFEVMPLGSCTPVLAECYEFLFLVSTASDDGVMKFYGSGGMNVLASQMPTLPDGSQSLDLAIKLAQIIISKVTIPKVMLDYPLKLLSLVATMARQFAIVHNALKFELLSFLTAVLSTQFPAPLREALWSMTDNNWPGYVRVGVIAILQNRVGPTEKLQALILAESMMSIIGEGWLIDQTALPDVQELPPAERSVLLVLESARVEVSVLLNEIAYLKYEAATSSQITDTMQQKQRNVATSFSLVERIIKLVSNIGSKEDTGIMSGSTFSKVISGLNETVGVVLDYLQDAREHKQKKGDDLLASVRLIGSYLAEAPDACRGKVEELLEYMLSVEGEDETGPFYSICFLLPMLCQITMDDYGCKALISFGGHKTVVQYLVKIIAEKKMAGDDDTILLACDTVMNILLKKEQLHVVMDESTIIDLLVALAYWTEHSEESSDIMMASSICSLLFDYTSEKALLRHPKFDKNAYTLLFKLMRRSLTKCGEAMLEEKNEESDLQEIITAGYSRWSDRFPSIKGAVER
uniref:Neurochondrin n=1 Tax=Kalanchoe fedtschenkoi TaxID=63787 RepID=A0A7N0ZSR6_KALFE